MDNLKLSAYPLPVAFDAIEGRIYPNGESENNGFTKLEKAALMIAEGFCVGQDPERQINLKAIATTSVHLAKTVIEECNK